jgi:tripartite-type tricarboxylate transporter receptor subunit TctC
MISILSRNVYAPGHRPEQAPQFRPHSAQFHSRSVANKRFADLGATAYPADKATPAALQAHVKAEIDKWAPIIKKAGVYAD